MSVRKIILSFLLSLAVLSVYAAPKKLFFDNFKLPLKRTHWLRLQPEDQAWQKEFKVESFGVRFLVRVTGNIADITDFKVLNGNGKIIMQTNELKKFDWVNFYGPFPYTVKIAGKPHAKPISIALDSHDNEDPALPAWKSVQMLSWSLSNCMAAALPESGMELTASGEKSGSLRGYVYDRSAKKKYRATLTVVSGTAQKVAFSASWQGNKKLREYDLLPGEETTLEVEFQPSAPTVNLQLLFNGKIKLKKFYLWEIK